MFNIKNGKILEQGDWECIMQLEKRVSDLEDNVSNLVAWAMNMQTQSQPVEPTESVNPTFVEKYDETSENVNTETE